jgi:hypothetical protein
MPYFTFKHSKTFSSPLITQTTTPGRKPSARSSWNIFRVAGFPEAAILFSAWFCG